MKKFLLFVVVQCFFSIDTNAQVGINSQQTITIHPNTIYQVDSDNKGVLFPRLTTAQRNTLSSQNPSQMPNGLIVYDTDLKCLLYWSSNLSNEAAGWKGHCAKALASNTQVPNNPATNSPGNNPLIP